jgi:putative zinc- or iron-chelating protein
MTTIKIEVDDETKPGARRCGGCTLCCKLLPMGNGVRVTENTRLVAAREFFKPAGERCPHQRTGKGCAIYDKRPVCCKLWNCRWLVNDDTAELRRPDRSHYVIDIMPDFVTLTEEGHESANVEVIQIWVDRKFPDAYKDPALLAYLERRGKEGIAAIIRYSGDQAFIMFPPAMTKSGKFQEHHGGTVRPERTTEERIAGLAKAQRVKIGGV